MWVYYESVNLAFTRQKRHHRIERDWIENRQTLFFLFLPNQPIPSHPGRVVVVVVVMGIIQIEDDVTFCESPYSLVRVFPSCLVFLTPLPPPGPQSPLFPPFKLFSSILHAPMHTHTHTLGEGVLHHMHQVAGIVRFQCYCCSGIPWMHFRPVDFIPSEQSPLCSILILVLQNWRFIAVCSFTPKMWDFRHKDSNMQSRALIVLKLLTSLRQNTAALGVEASLLNLLFLSSSTEHSFSSETVWVGTPPVYLSACLLRCMLCSQQPPNPPPPQSTWARVLCAALDRLFCFMSSPSRTLHFFHPQMQYRSAKFDCVFLAWFQKGWRFCTTIWTKNRTLFCLNMKKKISSILSEVDFQRKLSFAFPWSRLISHVSVGIRLKKT